MTAKNPRTPPAPLTREPRDIHVLSSPLWRIHWVTGAYPTRWDELREHGPVRSMRWDPHPSPEDHHPGIGVSYASADLATTVAEAFQGRTVALTRSKALVGWVPVRPLSLLDLTGDWPLRNGASASLHASPKPTCRAWARAIHDEWPTLDGLLAPSTMTGEPNVVLFAPAASAFPAAPAFSATLDQRTAGDLITPIARHFGWAVRR